MSDTDDSRRYSIIVERVENYEFRVRFDNPEFDNWTLDEPAPLGNNKGPNATRALAAAIGNCLSASLMFCLQRSKLVVDSIRSEVIPMVARNEEGRWRIQHLDVKVYVKMTEDEPKRFQRCVEIFENYCIVTSSVRQGIPVDVEILQES